MKGFVIWRALAALPLIVIFVLIMFVLILVEMAAYGFYRAASYGIDPVFSRIEGVTARLLDWTGFRR